MTSYVTPKKNSAFITYIGLPDYANQGRLKSGATIASGDFKVSKDGGAFANLTNLPVATSQGVQLSLTSTEMNADNVTIACVDQTSPPEWCDTIVNVQTSARQVDDLAYPATSGRSMVVDASGLVDANTVKVGPSGSGTAQTARDIGASVLLSAGTGTGQLDFTSGVVKANLAQILGTALTETAGQIAAAFKKLFDVASPVLTATSVNQTGDSYARLGAPAGASVSADIAAVKTDTAAIKTKTDSLTFTVAGMADANVVDWKGAAAPAMTGDAFARLGAPAGASVSADIAAVNAKTTNLPASPAAVSDIPTANANADALLDRADGIETGYTPRKILRLMASVLFGKVSGGGTTTNTFRDLGDTKARVTSTVDSDGNRTSVTLDGT
jgi:hypothetical protein